MREQRVEVLVVGGGLSGLALAEALSDKGVEVLVLEAKDEPGGNLATRVVETDAGRWVLDLGPNSFGDRCKAFNALVKRAKLASRIVPANEAAKRRLLWKDGRLQEVSSNPLKFLVSNVLPLSARVRINREPFVKPSSPEDPEESVAQFCDRRFGRSFRDVLVTPVIAGIFAGDPEELGAESAFPEIVDLEREYGSLMKAAMRGKGPTPHGTPATFEDGMAELPAALAKRLGKSLVAGTEVSRVEQHDGGWRVSTGAGKSFAAEKLVLALPSPEAAKLVTSVDGRLARDLKGVVYAPVLVAHVGAPRDAFEDLPDGIGFVAVRDEGVRLLGAAFSSELFDGRAPKDHVLVTVFAGGRLDPRAIGLSDASVRRFVLADLERAVGLADDPDLFELARWPRGIPQYVVGHMDRIARIEESLDELPGLHLLGDWRGGMTMEDCVAGADALADELADVRAAR
jgi:protoporphyrinogen/coproporphyrinogen III oxidase